MIALGVDPGTLRLGWGVVRREGNRICHVAHGVINLSPELELPERLRRIDEQLDRVVERHRPEVGSVETLFFHRDAQAAAKLGHARGVVLLCLARRGIPVAEYPPARVKRAIAGHGRAAKPQIARMVRALLALDVPPSSDAADALALAITHLRIAPLEQALAARRCRAATDPRPAGALGRSPGRRRCRRPPPRGK
jgi:crossover junction endodeoxyribonuclease RuvC